MTIPTCARAGQSGAPPAPRRNRRAGRSLTLRTGRHGSDRTRQGVGFERCRCARAGRLARPGPHVAVDRNGGSYTCRVNMSSSQLILFPQVNRDLADVSKIVTSARYRPISFGNHRQAAPPATTRTPADAGPHPCPALHGRRANAARDTPTAKHSTTPRRHVSQEEDARPDRTETERTRRPYLAGRLTKEVIDRYASLSASPLPLDNSRSWCRTRAAPLLLLRAERVSLVSHSTAVRRGPLLIVCRGEPILTRPARSDGRRQPLCGVHCRTPCRTTGAAAVREQVNGPLLSVDGPYQIRSCLTLWRVLPVIGHDASTPVQHQLAATASERLNTSRQSHDLVHAPVSFWVHPSQDAAHGEDPSMSLPCPAQPTPAPHAELSGR